MPSSSIRRSRIQLINFLTGLNPRSPQVTGMSLQIAPASAAADDNAESYGWRLVERGIGQNAYMEYQSKGDCFAWMHGSDLYLDQRGCHRLVRRMDPAFATTPHMLNTLLKNGGHLLTTDLEAKRKAFTVRLTIGGRQLDVLHSRPQCSASLKSSRKRRSRKRRSINQMRRFPPTKPEKSQKMWRFSHAKSEFWRCMTQPYSAPEASLLVF